MTSKDRIKRGHELPPGTPPAGRRYRKRSFICGPKHGGKPACRSIDMRRNPASRRFPLLTRLPSSRTLKANKSNGGPLRSVALIHVKQEYRPQPFAAGTQQIMGSLKKRRKAKINKHKRRKKLRAHRHKKRTWQK
jgi:hypothetical protein